VYVRKVGDGVYEAREGDRRVGGYEIAADGELRLDGDEALRAHALETARKLGFARLTLDGRTLEIPGPHLDGEELTRRTLRDFFDGERLKEMPGSLERRRIVLAWLASRFDEARRYTEADVNQLLLRHHPDFAMVRRYLVDLGLLERGGGFYWRAASQSFK
jgi:hypothetical protein